MKNVIVAVLALLVSAPVCAQEKPAGKLGPSPNVHGTSLPDKAPELSQAQQDQFTIAALAKDNAEKALRLAGIDYQKAGETFEKVVASLQVPGYTLQQNRETGKLERVKAPEPKAAPTKTGGG